MEYPGQTPEKKSRSHRAISGIQNRHFAFKADPTAILIASPRRPCAMIFPSGPIRKMDGMPRHCNPSSRCPWTSRRGSLQPFDVVILGEFFWEAGLLVEAQTDHHETRIAAIGVIGAFRWGVSAERKCGFGFLKLRDGDRDFFSGVWPGYSMPTRQTSSSNSPLTANVRMTSINWSNICAAGFAAGFARPASAVPGNTIPHSAPVLRKGHR